MKHDAARMASVHALGLGDAEATTSMCLQPGCDRQNAMGKVGVFVCLFFVVVVLLN